MQRFDQVYVDGGFRTANGKDELVLYNPTTEQPLSTVLLGDESDAEAAVESAKRALPGFARASGKERSDLLISLSEAVRARADDLTEATIVEYGGPKAQATWRAGLAADNFLAAAKLIRDYPLTRWINDSEVLACPAGVAAHIVPWNSLYNAISVKLAGALAAGCPVVVKPSEYSAWQAQLFAECVHSAGAPAGLINFVVGRGDVVGAALTRHPDVRKISFTGSTPVGLEIQRNAADRLVRTTLELGGKAPTIVMEDADLRVAARAALSIGFTNNGQACIAGTRILVSRPALPEFNEYIRDEIGAFVFGDPSQESVNMGPLVNQTQFDRVQGYIATGMAEGAEILTGGLGRPDGLERGYFVRPTIFTNVSNEMKIAREEIFGPVLCVIPYDSQDDAIRIANDTDFGLHAYVLGRDEIAARRLAERLDVGRVAINGLAHDPLAPFGGFKKSGIGREYGMFGIEDHIEWKSIQGRKAPS